jgi:hypothetical protein
MAAPADVTLQNLNGQFVMSKKLSDNIEPILVLVRHAAALLVDSNAELHYSKV